MAFAVKLQACTGVPGHDAALDPDFRGSEPADTHETLRIPGMGHGAELDPVDDADLPEWLEACKVVNERLFALTGHLPQHLELRVMDSDGHP